MYEIENKLLIKAELIRRLHVKYATLRSMLRQEGSKPHRTEYDVQSRTIVQYLLILTAHYITII